ncbi:hypothetical protein KOR42_23080 [Thalassoglobus neptunius]|uniref:Uncharacterized protein n=1 Tax=Thalassoglobus neptunius TaxID=1938619 RepID=A0A5C5X961_9PLAN|nr:hypothetical protein [Thalassoglobus neptunius]TWT58921.1 hypothetical protein KOR42_23080 [Thalassoglobus neptunius]
MNDVETERGFINRLKLSLIRGQIKLIDSEIAAYDRQWNHKRSKSDLIEDRSRLIDEERELLSEMEGAQ